MGTRPEMIKMAPLVEALDQSSFCESLLCSTGQQKHLLEQMQAIIPRRADFELDVMRPGKGLAQLTSELIEQVSKLLDNVRPDLVLVHGDTTTAMVSALAAFYAKIDIGHVEAGLRTGDVAAPWPEELNRRLIAQLARLHFAPTQNASKNLVAENISENNVWVTGNTGIDQLLKTHNRLSGFRDKNLLVEKHSIDLFRKLIVVTIHRRENFGAPLLEICLALREIAARTDVQIMLTIHPNPSIERIITEQLSDVRNIKLIPPQDYEDFIFLLGYATLVLSDSGGLQEEVPALGIPLLVLRETTERPEALADGYVTLVGASRSKIIKYTNLFLDNSEDYKARYVSPYGDGRASARIALIIQHVYSNTCSELIKNDPRFCYSPEPIADTHCEEKPFV